MSSFTATFLFLFEKLSNRKKYLQIVKFALSICLTWSKWTCSLWSCRLEDANTTMILLRNFFVPSDSRWAWFLIFEWVRRYINHHQSLVVVVCGFTCAVAVFVLNLRSHYLWVTFSIDHFRWTYLASELVNTLMIYFSLVTGSSLWNAFSRIGTRAQKRGSSIGKGKLWSP